MITYHNYSNGLQLAEFTPDNGLVREPSDILDAMAEAGYHGCNKLIINHQYLHPDFFDLKTRVAGEILQKFSNYRMQLAVVGDFSQYNSKSLQDFIRESNSLGIISFVSSIEKILS